ncbi:acetyl-CoA carboxylase biotin carboxyl carrier protein [Paenibacillus sp. TRM 82003]|nr:acetyl-CoA carboxylase biotin carboxyl carrier protein [Paenibacillus sp. TRM 82003]
MFKLSEIKELMKLVDSTSIQHLEIENENGKISIKKPDIMSAASAPAMASVPQPVYAPTTPAPAAVAPAPSAPTAEPKSEASAKDDLHRIVSPMVGTFYAAPSPDAPNFVKVGDSVNEKSVVCIVEAMKLMNEIEAEVKGQIVEVLVDNGQLVEYGQPLFLVKR